MEIVDFIQDNWLVIVGFLVELIVTIILCFIKKRPVVDSLDSWIQKVFNTFGPIFINEAEIKFPSQGKAKKDFVISKLVDSLSKIIALDSHGLEQANIQFANMIEDSLSTPQKKV